MTTQGSLNVIQKEDIVIKKLKTFSFKKIQSYNFINFIFYDIFKLIVVSDGRNIVAGSPSGNRRADIVGATPTLTTFSSFLLIKHESKSYY